MTAYQKYQLQWMIDHGHSLDDLMFSMTEYQVDGCEGTVAEIFDEWEFNSNGFGGEIWACLGEWKDCEAQSDPPELADALSECDAIITPAMDGYDNAKKLYEENADFRCDVAKKFNYYWGNYIADASDARFECVVDALSFVYNEWKAEGRAWNDEHS